LELGCALKSRFLARGWCGRGRHARDGAGRAARRFAHVAQLGTSSARNAARNRLHEPILKESAPSSALGRQESVAGVMNLKRTAAGGSASGRLSAVRSASDTPARSASGRGIRGLLLRRREPGCDLCRRRGQACREAKRNGRSTKGSSAVGAAVWLTRSASGPRRTELQALRPCVPHTEIRGRNSLCGSVKGAEAARPKRKSSRMRAWRAEATSPDLSAAL
jgi:hypothetical protein